MERFKIIKRAGRKGLIVRWHDGERWREQTTGETRRRDAERVARELLVAARQPTDDDWVDFKLAYFRGHLEGHSKSYAAVFQSACHRLERHVAVRRVSDVTPLAIAKLRTALRDEVAATTVASYLRHLRGALNWACRHGYIPAPVRVELPRQLNRGERSKGRPVTGEEFDRWLDAVDRMLPEAPSASLRRLMNGLWLSGLRLGEAIALTWGDPRRPMLGDIDARRPVLHMPAAFDKSRVDRLLPLTPDFVGFLRDTPLPSRAGLVFPVTGPTGGAIRSADAAGRRISAAGKLAGIVTKNGRHATAHDLRRSFATRWAPRLSPAVLREIMRHADIKTTLLYYALESAERTANEVWSHAVQPLGGVLGGAEPAAIDERSP
ncbi:MAG: tyrosine-type recombinase/integrase [Lacipirellulaceae bacterium]